MYVQTSSFLGTAFIQVLRVSNRSGSKGYEYFCDLASVLFRLCKEKVSRKKYIESLCSSSVSSKNKFHWGCTKSICDKRYRYAGTLLTRRGLSLYNIPFFTYVVPKLRLHVMKHHASSVLRSSETLSSSTKAERYAQSSS